MTPDTARDLVDGLRSGAEITLARGPDHLCTWREASRILAGFPDGRAAQGPQAGPATLVGLEIAKEHGWTAPPPPEASEVPDGAPPARRTAREARN
jgi:NADH-quinone oxidoreductase subunit E